ncbi:MAG: 16S rRNA (uracil(1498)-N(3))-methyltransferase [Verrucomicrobia bacterium]|nr:16S rRNA (uracil(1498)-N(3))-methyltransferase [Verrucomicrobiota bacterium]
MPVDRFFYPHSLKVSAIVLEGDEYHHLSVMRIRPSEEIEIVNGEGEIAKALVQSMSKNSAELKIISHQLVSPPSYELILAQALTKPSNLEWIVEKGTELGATAFWLFPGDRSEKNSLSENQLKRLEHITISALKQSGRPFLPKIELKKPLQTWTKPKGALLFGSLSPSAPLLSKPSSPCIFVVGPEKGLSPEEINFLQQSLQAQGVKLHDNTLRAETAALCALSQLSLLIYN